MLDPLAVGVMLLAALSEASGGIGESRWNCADAGDARADVEAVEMAEESVATSFSD